MELYQRVCCRVATEKSQREKEGKKKPRNGEQQQLTSDGRGEGRKAKPNTLLYLTGKESNATVLIKGNTSLRGSNMLCQGIKSICREQRKKGKGGERRGKIIKYERVHFG